MLHQYVQQVAKEHKIAQDEHLRVLGLGA